MLRFHPEKKRTMKRLQSSSRLFAMECLFAIIRLGRTGRTRRWWEYEFVQQAAAGLLMEGN